MGVKIFLILFLTLPIVLRIPIEDPKCTEFRTGKFALIGNPISHNYIIERNDSLQVETDLTAGSVSKFKVTWVNECAYELTILEGNEVIMNFYKDRTLSVRIIETFKDGYKFESQLKGIDSYVLTQTLRVVK